MLAHAASGNNSYPSARNVLDLKNAKSARVIFRNYNPYIHPMHLHGHNFQVLAEGTGAWDGTVTNPANPQRRDTHLMPPGMDTVPTYLVMQWESDNPGVWPLHCHLLIHSNPGLTVNMLVS
jgi:FtsP/CotA-like multicopper oxidase with cupredoxin domain